MIAHIEVPYGQPQVLVSGVSRVKWDRAVELFSVPLRSKIVVIVVVAVMEFVK